MQSVRITDPRRAMTTEETLVAREQVPMGAQTKERAIKDASQRPRAQDKGFKRPGGIL